MSKANSLSDVYLEEIRDLWSANDQMQRIMPNLAEAASDDGLKSMLRQSVDGIGKHTAALKAMVEEIAGDVGKDHCRGMEGLVEEAKKHALEAEFSGHLRDLAIISQYQRMSHYGLAGFGTAAAYAAALGKNDDASKLKAIVGEIYKADEYSSQLAKQAEQSA